MNEALKAAYRNSDHIAEWACWLGMPLWWDWDSVKGR